jgi:SecD/SecF fusion protein
MQNKGTIKFFAIAFALVCVYSLSFTLCTRQVEKNAKSFAINDQVKAEAKKLANGDASKETFYLDSLSKARESYFLDSMSNEVIYNVLVRKYTYRDCKSRELNLGLDLKGGMNVTLEISIPDIVTSLAGKNASDPMFKKAFDKAVERSKTSQTDFITLFGQAFTEIAPNGRLASFFSFSLPERVKTNTPNDEVLKALKGETSAAVDRTFQILRTRIDRFGVAQPNIQKLGQSGRILVELPGIKEPERVRKLLQGTANLEFWKTYDLPEIYPALVEANKKIAAFVNGDLLSDSLKTTDSSATAVVKKDSNALAETVKKDTSKKALNQAQREKENPLFSLLQLSADQQTGTLNKGAVVGYASVKDTAKINHMLEMVKATLPRDLRLAWEHKAMDEKAGIIQLIALKAVGEKGAVLTGDAISDARQDYSDKGGNEISMTMNPLGAKTWKKITGESIGKCIAIVLDGYVYSAPTVQNEIPNGRSSITGRFTLEEAKDLANILKAGKLPAPARIVEEAVVGPSLGQEAINSGMWSFIFAFLGVLLYMALYYNRAGNVANIALFCNVFFMFGVLASLGAVLTLPGIAGMVLTFAMAVDGNVIIYERMREEIRTGKGVRLMVKDGFHHAYSSIIDGHVTTILTGVVLYIFGSGPVQGFATTLIVGLVLSLFTSLLVSRLVFEWMLNKDINISVGNKYTINAFSKIKIPFIEIRKIMYVASGIVIAIGIVSLVTRGMSLGIDFTGGRTFIVRFDENVNTEDIRMSLAKQYDGEAPEVKTFGPSNQVKITTKYRIKDNDLATDSIVESKLYEGVKTFYKAPIDFKTFSAHGEKDNKAIGKLQSQKIGPTIAKDLVYSAILAVFFSLIIIFIYIAIRFRNWQYGLGGVISLAHDSMIVITVFSLFHGVLPFNMEVDQQFIAAILTIIGYSIMDSVIIFDRIREYTRIHPKLDLKSNIDMAINSTLGRTINTSGITILVLIIIFIFGGEVLRGFIFALLIGVTIGTYSSVFNATPIAYDLIMLSKKRKEKKANIGIK